MEHKEDVLAEIRGFMQSRIILTAAELDLFTKIDDRPAAAQSIAEDGGLDPRATERLLNALTAFGLLKKEQGIYRLTEKGAPLSSRHAETVLPMVLHQAHLWETWSRLTDVVRRGPSPQRWVSGPEQEEESRRAFIGAMHVVGRNLSRETARFADPLRFKRLLDIGGASGSYTMAFLRENPGMTAVLFDLEGVVPLAAERLEREGLLDRVTLVAGDFYQDELPGGCDVALLSAIIHQNGPRENLALYSKIHRALEPGGILIIRDHIMDESRTVPPSGAVFAVNMLVNTPSGDTYTFAEVKETLEAAGFAEVRQTKVGIGMDSLVEARKPVPPAQ